jgi:hypothetical protein
MKKIIRRAAVPAMGVALALSAGCGSSDGSSVGPPAPPATTAGVTTTTTTAATSAAATTGAPTVNALSSYSPEIRRAYLRACETTSGGRTAYCTCTFQWLESHYSQADFVRFSGSPTSRESLAAFRAAAAACPR